MRRYENVEIKRLRPYERNARTHSLEQIQKIAESINEFGFVNPVLIDEKYTIIAGHGRVLAAEELGLLEVPCVFVEDLSDVQKSAYIIADNCLAEDAGWDFEILSQELGSLKNFDFNIELTGFSLDDLEFDFEKLQIKEEEIPEIKKDSKSKHGDIYQLGRHRIMCGDSTDFSDIEKLLAGSTVDLLITDPPYNVDYSGKTKDSLKIGNDNMSDSDFENFLQQSFRNADSVMKPGAAFYIWHSDSNGYIFRKACEEVGWKVRQCLIWNKNSMVLGRQDYQ